METARAEGYVVRCISPHGTFVQLLTNKELDWDCLPFYRGSRVGVLSSVLRSCGELKRLFRLHRPDVIHSFTLTSILLTWMSRPSMDHIKRVNAVTGLGYLFTTDTWKSKLGRCLILPLLKRALAHDSAWTVVQNKSDQAFLTDSLAISSDRLRLIPGSGVDIERFRPRKLSKPRERVVVGFSGRLLTDKGIEEFVEAAKVLRKHLPHVRFVAAGVPDAGNPASVAESRLAEWEKAGDIEFVGHVDDMPAYLNGLDIFVLPSYREGLPRSLLEAGACGLPAVTTEVPGCVDVIQDEVNGLIVPPREHFLLAEAISKLAVNSEARQQMGKMARIVVAEYFSDSVINKATLDLYKDVLSKMR